MLNVERALTEPITFLATAQPFSKQCDGYGVVTTLLTRGDRVILAQDASDSKLGHIPCVIDHAGANMQGKSPKAPGFFKVPPEMVIGRLIAALVRANGHLLVIGELYAERSETQMIMKDLISGKHRWGVSLCTDYMEHATTRRISDKRVSHVGITKNPEYGDEGTWFHIVSGSKKFFYDKLDENIIRNEPGMFVPDSLREIIKRARNPGTVPVSVGASAYLRSPSPGPSAICIDHSLHWSRSNNIPMADQLLADPAYQALSAKIKTFRSKRSDESSTSAPLELYEAATLNADLDNVLASTNLPYGQIPEELHEAKALLTSTIRGHAEKANKFAQDFYDNATYSTMIKPILEGGHKPQNMNGMVQVMATRDAHLMNQRQAEAKREAEQKEWNEKFESLKQEMTAARRPVADEPAAKRQHREIADAQTLAVGGTPVSVGATKSDIPSNASVISYASQMMSNMFPGPQVQSFDIESWARAMQTKNA